MRDFGSAIILAGGKSTRMGFDKQLLYLRERRLMDNLINKLKNVFDDIIIVTNKPEYYCGLAHRITEDIISDGGPLGGIHAGLSIASSRYSYVIACDMPNINQEYIEYMKNELLRTESQGCVSMYGSFVEPFNAFYSKDLILPIEKFLSNGQRAIHRFLHDKNFVCIPETTARKYSPDWDMFFNLNTREDVSTYLKREGGV